MKRILKVLAISALGLAMTAPDALAQRPGNRGRGSSSSTQTQRPAPGNQQRPGGNNSSQRPQHGNNNSRPQQGNNNSRPQQGNNNNRPQQGGNNFRPGDNNRPGNNFNNDRPQHNQRPQAPGPEHGHNPGPGYGHGHGPGPGHGPGHVPPHMPYRPYMPANRPFHRPVPPPHFRPMHGGPVIGTILGVAIGTTINMTMNYLLRNGVAVTGYTNDALYLNNVNQLNMMWPNATLYYNTMGGLIGSEFVYSTPYYDLNRYNMAYRMLVNSYGMPVSSVNLAGGGVQVSWFGFDGQYVQLQYLPGNAYDGSYRYYTTLSFGR